MARFTIWFSRFVIVAAAFVFTMIAIKYIADPVGTARVSGIMLSSPLAMTDMRVGFGAFPLGFALVVLGSLLSERRLLFGLSSIAIVVGVALAVRLYGVSVDHTLTQSVALIRAESLMFLFSLLAIAGDLKRRSTDTHSLIEQRV